MIVSGMYVVDQSSNPAPIPNSNGNIATTVNTVTGVGSYTVNLSQGIAHAVGSGDVIHFAAPRSSAAPLGTCNTTVPGSGLCEYPWGIYNNGAQNADFDYVFMPNTWQGIYQNGPTFHLGYVQMCAFSQGLNAVASGNFPQIDDFEFWDFNCDRGSNSAPTNNANIALADVFYDGQTIAANFGGSSGVAIGKFQSWTGAVNITSASFWAHFGSLMLDGNNSNLNITNCNFIQIANMYTTKGSLSSGTPISQSGGTGCTTIISNLFVSTELSAEPIISMSAGVMAILGGHFGYAPTAATNPAISVTGGKFIFRNNDLGIGGAGTTFISQTIAGTIDVQNNNWGATTQTAVSIANDSVADIVTGNNFNGNTFIRPGYSGTYYPNSDASIAPPQLFTTPGSGMWTKVGGSQWVQVQGCGAAGGGGGGALETSGTAASGGGGGGGGACYTQTFRTADFGTTENLNVGLGGAGGAAASSNTTAGSNGISGGATTFGGGGALFTAGGGGGAAGGQLAATTSGGGGGGSIFQTAAAATGAAGGGGGYAAGNGGTGATAANVSASVYGAGGAGSSVAGVAGNGGSSGLTCPGGGAGGGVTSGGSPSGNNGGNGGFALLGTVGVTSATGGTSSSVNGQDGSAAAASTTTYSPGNGGGGGYGNASGNAGNGGVGNQCGGGGGGGSALNGSTAGNGGNGGNGFLIITSW